ncbi:MAG: DUF2149 domain-containing protein [Planctomycetota bacterium]
MTEGRRSGGRHRRLLAREEPDPLTGVANLFDVALVFAVALLLAALQGSRLVQRAAGGGDPAPQARVPLARYRLGRGERRGEGVRLGVAYRLASGEVVYVPEGREGR